MTSSHICVGNYTINLSDLTDANQSLAEANQSLRNSETDIQTLSGVVESAVYAVGAMVLGPATMCTLRHWWQCCMLMCCTMLFATPA